MPQILLFNKPFNVMCQFTEDSELANQRQTLADFIDLPGFYAAGRLDRDSEGLLLLTNDGKLQQRISDPTFKLAKTYLVQVEGEIDDKAIAQLEAGLQLKDGLTRPAKAKRVNEPKWLWERIPPIRKRQNIPTSWLELTIAEGKNRQVRRMTAAVGLPTLRLIRMQIGPWKLGNLPAGKHQLVDLKPEDLPPVPAAKNRRKTAQSHASKAHPAGRNSKSSFKAKNGARKTR